MDKLIEILRGTLDPNQSKEAEQLLSQVKKIIGFCPNLFTISVTNEVEEGIRQAAAIALKNNVSEYWMEIDDPSEYSIHEEDKAFIRMRIVEAIVKSPTKINVLLLESLQTMIRNDFPGRWENFPVELINCLMSTDLHQLIGGYQCLLKLVKCFEYRKNNDRVALNQHMHNFLEIMKKHIDYLINDQSEASVTVQKLIIKVYYVYTHLHLSIEIVERVTFEYWINVLCNISQRDVPDEANRSVDAEERPTLIWWKCKKWAVHTLSRFTDKYSNPSSVIKIYKEFSMWFLHQFTEKIIQTLFSVCEKYSQGVYIAPRILTFVIISFEYLIKHSHSWKYLKPHLLTLVKEVLFKMLSHNEEDQELWNEDPMEYCKQFFDVLSDPSPRYTAGNLLTEVCQKRKGALETIMTFVTEVLNSSETTVIQKDTAFHIIGHVASVLLKRKEFASQMEAFVINYVVPVFQAPEGFRRFRACWLVEQLAEAEFHNKDVLRAIVEQTLNSIANDPELPVKVMAANTLSGLLVSKGEEIKDVITPHLNPLIVQILTLLRDTQVDDLNDVLQNVISLFADIMTPIAIDTVLHLKETVATLLDDGDIDDNKELIIMGVLSTVEIVCKAMESHENIICNLEPIVVSIIEIIFRKEAVDFYEEAYSLAASLTMNKISPTMWQVLLFAKTVIKSDPDEISDMMSLLSNFVSVDKPSLVADATRIETLIELCNSVLNNEDVNDTYESYAAKLLEMTLLNYHGLVDQYVQKIIEIVISRLVRKPDNSELRTMCLQTIMAALYYNKDATLTMLLSHNWPGTNSLIIDEFICQVFNDMDKFLGIHDRKLCIIALSILLSLPANQRPQSLQQIGVKVMPALIKMMDTLKNTYVNMKDEESDEEEDDEEQDEKALDTDENEEDEECVNYMEMIQNADNGVAAVEGLEEDDDEDDDSQFNEFTTELEEFETVLDEKELEMSEFTHIYQVISSLNVSDPEWYGVLTSSMTEEHNKTLQSIMELTNNNNKEKESKKAEIAQ